MNQSINTDSNSKEPQPTYSAPAVLLLMIIPISRTPQHILTEAIVTRYHLDLSHVAHCIMGFIQFWITGRKKKSRYIGNNPNNEWNGACLLYDNGSSIQGCPAASHRSIVPLVGIELHYTIIDFNDVDIRIYQLEKVIFTEAEGW